MSVLDSLPSQDLLTEILSPVLGDGNTSGVSGAASLLQDIKPDTIADTIAAQLDGALSSVLPTSTGAALTGDIVSRFEQALNAVPVDPSALTAPVRDVIDRILALAGDQLSGQLQSGLAGFEGLGSMRRFDASTVAAEITPAVDQVKEELLRGAFGQLRQWSAGVETLGAEVQQIIATGGPALIEALIALLTRIVSSVERAIFPSAVADAERLAGPLRDATSPDRLAALPAAQTAVEQALSAATAAVRAQRPAENEVADVETRFAELTAAIEAILTDVDAALSADATTPEGLARVMERRLESFENVEIIDVGAIRDTIASAITSLQSAVEGLRLERVGEMVRDGFAQIDAAIAKIDLRQFADELDALRGEMKKLTESIEGALVSVVASARDLLRSARDQLRAVLESVGSFDADGTFHFDVEQQIREFLDGVKASFDDTVRPVIDNLRTTVGDVAREAESALQSVEDAIAGVKQQLTDAVQRAVDEIDAADLPGQIASMRDELASMLTELGTIDFDVVVDPVVAEINEIAEALASIDTSSLNDLLKEALKAATKIITDIDFSTEITKVLTQKLDEVLVYPKQALDEIQVRVREAIDRFGELALEKLLEPLYKVYTPIEKAMAHLQLASLVQPLDEWHGRAMAAMEKLSPEALLEPLIVLHGQLMAAVDAVSPAELVRPLQDLLEQGAGRIESLNVAGVATDIRAAVARARAQLDALKPDQLLSPIVAEFDKIVSALEAFDPKELLRPITQLFDGLTAPLAQLNDTHAKAIEIAFAPLAALPQRMDPRPAFAAMAAAVMEAQRSVAMIDPGAVLAALRTPHAGLRAAVTESPSASGLSARVEALDPLRSDAMGRAINRLRQTTTRLGQQFPSAEPPSALIERYEKSRPRLESLVPDWIKPPVTAESIRKAFSAASILGVGDEIDNLYGAIKTQVRAVDPRLVQEEIREAYAHLEDALLGLDPAILLDELQADLAQIAQRLRALDLTLLTAELDGIVADLRGVVAGLDPRPIIAQLEALVDDVREVVASLKPSELLAELQEPLDSVQAIVHAFDPQALATPVREGLDRIDAILAQVDLRILLDPIYDKLHELRDGLDAALDRTETAFDAMISAIPL